MVPDEVGDDFTQVAACDHLFKVEQVTFEECLHQCCGGREECNAFNYYPTLKECALKKCNGSVGRKQGDNMNMRRMHISLL